MRAVLVILLLQLLSVPVRAQQSQNVAFQSDLFVERYNMSCLDLTVGLPHNNVNHIFVDSKGFIWVSSYGGGAVRYDGYMFMRPHLMTNGGSISNSCKGFAEDRHQRLWTAYDEGVVVLDMSTMRRTVPPTKEGDINHLLMKASVNVYCDSKGALWHLTRDTIYRYTFAEDGSVSHISRLHCQGNTPDVCIRDIEQNGTVWVNVDNGLYRVCEINGRLERREIAPVMDRLRGLYVTDLLKRDNDIWISTNQGLYAYNMYDSSLRNYHHTADEHSLSHDYATALATTSDGRLLVGTLRGLCAFNDQTGTFRCWNSSTAGAPMPSDFVHCLLTYGHQLWIGTETAGVVCLTHKPLLLRNYVNSPQRASSLSPHPVNAMYVEQDGTLWVGTVEGGLNRKTPAGDFEHWTTRNSGLTHNSISVLEGDGKNRLWLGTWGGGVHVVSLTAPNTIRHIDMPNEMAVWTNYVGALAYDSRNDALWIGSNDGIFLYDLKTGRIEDPFEGNRTIHGCIGAHIDREGMLWIGCLSGVCVIDLKSANHKQGQYRFRSRHLRQKLDHPESPVVDKITCFCETRDGTLWLGSNGYGLYKRVKSSAAGSAPETFEVLTTDDGLANNAVKGIVEDAQGRLWVTTNNGLSIYDPDTHTFMNYGEHEGLLCQQFYWNSAVKSPDGAIYLGSVAGLTEIRGENTDVAAPVHLTFTQLLVDNQEVTANDNGILDADISQAKRIRLHESNKSFAINFSTLTFEGDIQGHYSYRLKGFEDDWTILKQGEHSVRYTSLKPGTYTFEVAYSLKSSNEPYVISIEVKVAPYFWKSWWFLLLSAFVVLAVLLWQIRQRVESLRRQEAEKLLVPIRKAMDDADDPEQLQQRIQTILDNHEHLKNSFRRTVEADKQEAMRTRKSFVERATDVMEQNYGNSEFGISEFAEALGMSTSLVSKRLNAETGQSTSQFIRNYRLTVGRKLLLENYANRNITEIAYKVGFNDPKYFTRCFTRLYGCSPSSYAEEDVKVDK